MSDLLLSVHRSCVPLARLCSGVAAVIALAGLACSSGDSPELEHAGTTDGAIDICDGIEVIAGSDDAPASVTLRRPATIEIPELIAAEGEVRGEVDLRLDTEDLGMLHACFAAAASGGFRLDRVLRDDSPCSNATAARVPVLAGDELVVTSVRMTANTFGREVRWTPSPVDCGTTETGAGSATRSASSSTATHRTGRTRGPLGPAGLGGGVDPQAVTATGSTSSASGGDTGATDAGDAGDDGASVGDDSGGGTMCPPPDPGVLAPDLDLTVTTSLYEAVRFMFEDEPLVQQDVAPGTINRTHASLLRGTVLGPDDQPLACVRVEVVGRPELGWTATRNDGRFDLVVNGGGPLVLEFSDPDVIVAHRRVSPVWNEAHTLQPVKLIEHDLASTAIDFTDPIQVHLATTVDDDDGTRQAALMFHQGTIATMVMSDGSTQPATELTVRATEFTVGANGLASMPAALPTGTQYTYAIEFTADEIEAANARTVLFDPAAALYVDNFLDVPVGTIVPSGSYDRAELRWNTEPNGRIVEILSITAGAADLDLEGEGIPATPAELTALGITTAEREMLASLYTVGTTLTRMPVLHFTEPLDCNFPGRPPDDASEPPEGGPEENQEEDCASQRDGSIIECEGQVLGQRLAVPGTPFTLNYRSSRVPGAPSRHLRLPIAGAEVPASLHRARLEVTVAERTFESVFDTVTPNQSAEFAWDGLDAYGRAIQGAQPARVCLVYDYPATYQGTDRAIDEEVFGDWAQDGVAISGRDQTEVGLSRCYSRGPFAGAGNVGTINKSNMIRLGGLDARSSAAALGGWTLSVHHALGLETSTLYLGSGEKRELGDNKNPVAVRVAGNGTTSGANTGTSAVGCRVVSPTAIAAAPDGSIYVASATGVSGQNTAIIRRLTTDGELEAFAGTGTSGALGDGGPATSASFSNFIVAMQVGPDGSVYVADRGANRIRKIDPEGVIQTIAGTGVGGSCVDTGMVNGHGNATSVPLPGLADIELTEEGELWLINSCGSSGGQRIRRLVGDTLVHVAGWGYPTWLSVADRPKIEVDDPDQPTAIFGWDASIQGDSTSHGGFAAKWAHWREPHAFAATGTTMYVAEGSASSGADLRKIRELSRVGVGIRTYRRSYEVHKNAQNNYPCNSTGCTWTITEDGISTTIDNIAILPPYGLVYFTNSTGGNQVRIAPADKNKGALERLLGGGTEPLTGANLITPALNYKFSGGVSIHGGNMAVGADGALYVADYGGHKIVKLANSGPSLYGAVTIPSQDGSELYEFDDEGRHLATRDGWTHAIIWTFTYDTAGRLIEVIDGDGNATTVAREPDGRPTAIVSPDGVTTSLELDANGYVETIAYPTGDAYEFTSSASGLMSSMTTPRAELHEFTYDSLGRLERDDDPEGGYQALTRTQTSDDDYAVAHETALGLDTTYAVARNDAKHRTRTQTLPDGTTNTIAETPSSTTVTVPDGTVIVVATTPDRRLGSHPPIPSRVTMTTPGGHTRAITTTRESTLSSAASLAASTITETTVSQDNANRTRRRQYFAEQGSTPALLVTRSPDERAILAELGTNARVDRLRFGTWASNAFVPSTFHDILLGYDGRGRLETLTQGTGADQRTTSFHYNVDGFLDRITSAAGQLLAVDGDEVGRPSTITLPSGEVLGLSYDPDGNLTGVTPPGRPQHVLAYDGLGLLARSTPPDVVTGDDFTEYLYDLDHGLTDVVRPDGRTLSFDYDGAGRVDTLTLTDSVRTFAYWQTSGTLRSFSESGGGTTELTWDGPLLTSSTRTGSFAGSVTWAYANDFGMSSETVVGTPVIAYGYDDDDLLVSAGAETITHHPVSGAVSNTTLGSVTTALAYSPFAELASLTYAYGATTLYHADYQRDDLGRIESLTETIGGVTHEYEYEYDLAGRLDRVLRDGVETDDAVYDGNGNRTELETSSGTRTASHDNQDRLIDDGPFEFTYSGAGELETRTDTASSDTTTYEYDELGNLTRVVLPNSTEVRYEIDGVNRRIGKRVDGAIASGWLYGQQAAPVAELDSLGAIRSRFVYGTRPHVPDFMIMGGTTYRIVTDHLGSVRLVVNVATGTVAQRIDYDVWGVVVADTAPGFQPFGYAGGLYDPDTGLVRFGARDYDAAVGRWTSKDPIGFVGGDTNVYRYAAGDPVNLTDVAGLGFDSVSRTCTANPVLCAEAGLLSGAAAPRIQQAAQAAQRASSAAQSAASTVAKSCGGVGPVNVGKAGEAAVRATGMIGPKPNMAIEMSGRLRIPDGLTNTVLSEVKNVQRLSFTQQLRDYLAFAEEHGLRFDLWYRPGAHMSPRLEQAIAEGRVNPIPIPFP